MCGIVPDRSVFFWRIQCSAFVFEVGARLMGVVEPCGLGEPVPHEGVASSSELWEDCFESNTALLEHLRSDKFESELMSQAEAYAKLGRMTKPIPGRSVVCFAVFSVVRVFALQ